MVSPSQPSEKEYVNPLLINIQHCFIKEVIFCYRRDKQYYNNCCPAHLSSSESKPQRSALLPGCFNQGHHVTLNIVQNISWQYVTMSFILNVILPSVGSHNPGWFFEFALILMNELLQTLHTSVCFVQFIILDKCIEYIWYNTPGW